MPVPGIVFAVVAMLAWTFGDFYIQKATREVGVWRCIFWIGASASIVLFPWVIPHFHELLVQPSSIGIILATSLVGLAAALSNLHAWKIGKLAIIQPILGLEIVVAAILGWLVFDEGLAGWQTVLIVLTLVGLFLISLPKKLRQTWSGKGVERGVLLGLFGALLLGGSDLMVGLASRTVSPLVATWAIHTMIADAARIAILRREGPSGLSKGLRSHGRRILAI